MLDKPKVMCYNIVMKMGEGFVSKAQGNPSRDRSITQSFQTPHGYCSSRVEGSGGMTANAPRIARPDEVLRRGGSSCFATFKARCVPEIGCGLETLEFVVKRRISVRKAGKVGVRVPYGWSSAAVEDRASYVTGGPRGLPLSTVC